MTTPKHIEKIDIPNYELYELVLYLAESIDSIDEEQDCKNGVINYVEEYVIGDGNWEKDVYTKSPNEEGEKCGKEIIYNFFGSHTNCSYPKGQCPIHDQTQEGWGEELKKLPFWNKLMASEQASLQGFIEILLTKHRECKIKD